MTTIDYTENEPIEEGIYWWTDGYNDDVLVSVMSIEKPQGWVLCSNPVNERYAAWIPVKGFFGYWAGPLPYPNRPKDKEV